MKEYIGMKKIDEKNIKQAEELKKEIFSAKPTFDIMAQELHEELKSLEDVKKELDKSINSITNQIVALKTKMDIIEKAIHIRTSKWVLNQEGNGEQPHVYECEFCKSLKSVNNPLIDLTRYCEICGAYMFDEN